MLEPLVTAAPPTFANLTVQGRTGQHFWPRSPLLLLPTAAWHAAPSWVPADPAPHDRRHLGDSRLLAKQAMFLKWLAVPLLDSTICKEMQMTGMPR